MTRIEELIQEFTALSNGAVISLKEYPELLEQVLKFEGGFKTSYEPQEGSKNNPNDKDLFIIENEEFQDASFWIEIGDSKFIQKIIQEYREESDDWYTDEQWADVVYNNFDKIVRNEAGNFKIQEP